MFCLNFVFVFPCAGTVDYTFETRLCLGGPLVKENIATMVLERLESLFNVLYIRATNTKNSEGIVSKK
jgi:hypothetical protein